MTSPAPASALPTDADVEVAWAAALALWGVQMHSLVLHAEAGPRQAIAWFGFPPEVNVNLKALVEAGLGDELDTVVAHEVGHHVVSPGTRIDSLKIRHQIARALVACGAREPNKHIALLSNLWTDLLVNNRLEELQRRAAPGDEAGIVRARRVVLEYSETNRVDWLYQRTYERLWRLPAGSLAVKVAPPAPPPALLAPPGPDAHLAVPTEFQEQEKTLLAAHAEVIELQNRLANVRKLDPQLDSATLAQAVRSFAHDPVTGALVAGLIFAPYFMEMDNAAPPQKTGGGKGKRKSGPGDGPPPHGCTEVGEEPTQGELARVLADRRVWEPLPQVEGRTNDKGEVTLSPDPTRAGGGGGQALGIAHTLALHPGLDRDKTMIDWYKIQAGGHVRPWTTKRSAAATRNLPGPLEQWDTGDDLADIDWPGTFHGGAIVIPGVTTVRRTTLDDDPEPKEGRITLDLYVDSSGSMLHPSAGSPAVLAGAILILSILKGGGEVRVTSFSGPGQVGGNAKFTHNIDDALRALFTYFGGGTTFPLDLYAARYQDLQPPAADESRHVVVLSDDGAVSLFGQGNAAMAHVAPLVRSALSTATVVAMDSRHTIADAAKDAHYDVIYIETMEEAPAVCAKLAEVLRG